jgi:hypothetical protein
MLLQQGAVESYDSDRGIVKFTMLDGDRTVLCAITTAAMDDLEASRNSGLERVEQFMRLRAKIEARAASKFEEQGEINKVVMLRSNDFSK